MFSLLYGKQVNVICQLHSEVLSSPIELPWDGRWSGQQNKPTAPGARKMPQNWLWGHFLPKWKLLSLLHSIALKLQTPWPMKQAGKKWHLMEAWHTNASLCDVPELTGGNSGLNSVSYFQWLLVLLMTVCLIWTHRSLGFHLEKHKN